MARFVGRKSVLKYWDGGSNGGGEGAEEERRQWEEDDAKTQGGGRYLEVQGSRRERKNSCFNIREAECAKYFYSKVSEVPTSRLVELTVTRWSS